MILSSSLILELEDITEPRAEACLAPNNCAWPNCTCYPQRVAPEPTPASIVTSMACQTPERCYFPSCTCSRPSACPTK